MGQTPHRANIVGITNSKPCVITTEEAHEFATSDFVRLTDLNGVMPVPRGEDPLNNYRFQIIVLSDTTFKILDPITHKEIDSTNYTPYVEGGFCNLIARNYIYHNDNS